MAEHADGPAGCVVERKTGTDADAGGVDRTGLLSVLYESVDHLRIRRRCRQSLRLVVGRSIGQADAASDADGQAFACVRR